LVMNKTRLVGERGKCSRLSIVATEFELETKYSQGFH
jgi:hypothetical protein